MGTDLCETSADRHHPDWTLAGQPPSPSTTLGKRIIDHSFQLAPDRLGRHRARGLSDRLDLLGGHTPAPSPPTTLRAVPVKAVTIGPTRT